MRFEQKKKRCYFSLHSSGNLQRRVWTSDHCTDCTNKTLTGVKGRNQAKQQSPLLQQNCLQSQEQPDLRTSRFSSAWDAEILSRNELEWLIPLHKSCAISYCKDLLVCKSFKYPARYSKWQEKGTQHVLVSEELLSDCSGWSKPTLESEGARPPSLLTLPFCLPSACGVMLGMETDLAEKPNPNEATD